MTPDVLVPPSENTVRVRMFDTTTKMSTGAKFFVEPVRPGHEVLNLTDVGFLIENERLDRRVLFDLGCKKDYWNSPPPLADRLDRILTGIKVDKNASEVLIEAGIDLKSIDSIIWSHAHFDHIGDITLFPPSTSLVVGPGFSKAFLPAYPENPESRLDSAFFEGRALEEIDMEDAAARGQWLSIAGFDAVDYFGDGSFYLLSAPGHCQGHVCGLARTMPDTFVLMGGDVAHFAGSLRPSEGVPLPDPIPQSAGLDARFYESPCPCSAFDHILADADGAKNRGTPFYQVSRDEHSAYVDPEQATEDMQKVRKLDASPNVFVCIAHDPSLLEVLPTLNDDPGQDINEWRNRGWKEKCRWKFLSELPRPNGERGKPVRIEGMWREGRVDSKPS